MQLFKVMSLSGWYLKPSPRKQPNVQKALKKSKNILHFMEISYRDIDFLVNFKMNIAETRVFFGIFSKQKSQSPLNHTQ